MPGPTLVILAAGRARRFGGIKQLAPIGKYGEATIDLIASDAIEAGFTQFVIVINRDTGPTIEEHVRRTWPRSVRVDFAFQDALRGTVDAVLSARDAVTSEGPFGISNADDIYGRDAFSQLGRHLIEKDTACLVGFRLENSLVGDLPVSRGVCSSQSGMLHRIDERLNVHETPEGIVADDGVEPRVLDPSSYVSMNLWGFPSHVWPLLQRAVDEHDFTQSAEVLLPLFVADVMHRDNMAVDFLMTNSRCIGVTHAEDLRLAQYLLREEIAAGLRPERAFSADN